MRRVRLLIVLLCTAALVSGLHEAVALMMARNAARASAASAAQGTGGQFVSVQGRVLDTRPGTQVGPYSTKMAASSWRSLQVAGMTMSDGSKLPASISAVAVNFSVIKPAGAGYLNADKDDDSPNASIAYMRYVSTEDQSNTGTLAVAANGRIQVRTSNVADLLVDVEGYYTADDSVAPGGYVPITPKRIVDTYYGIGRAAGKLAGGSTTTIPVAGSSSGVPMNATAAILNVTTAYDTSTASHYYVPYPADEVKPTKVSMSFPVGDTDASQLQVGLSKTGSPIGAFKLFLSAGSYSIHLQVDVLGYFIAGSSAGAFVPAATRVYATGTYDTSSPKRSAVAPGATAKVQVAGVNGVPLAGSGISAVAMHLSVYAHGTNGGYAAVWASGRTRPSPYSSVNLARNGNFIGNMVTTELGADGAVSIFNQSQDAIDVLVDIEGWYTGAGLAIPSDQTDTDDVISLQAEAGRSGAWVTYQYRLTEDASFQNVPVADVLDVRGSKPLSWPVQRTGPAFEALSWNARNSLAALPANQGFASEGFIQVQACFGVSQADTDLVCGMPSTVYFTGDKPDADGAESESSPVDSADLDSLPSDEETASDVTSRTLGGTLRNVSGVPQTGVEVTITDGEQQAPDNVSDAAPFLPDTLGSTVTDQDGKWSFTLPDPLPATQDAEAAANGGVLNVNVAASGATANSEQPLIATAAVPVGVGSNSAQAARSSSAAPSSLDAAAIADAVASQGATELTLHASSGDNRNIVPDPTVEQPGELAANATTSVDSNQGGAQTAATSAEPIIDSNLSDATFTKGNAPAEVGSPTNPDVINGIDYRQANISGPQPQANARPGIPGPVYCGYKGVSKKKYDTRYTVIGEAHAYWNSRATFLFQDRFSNTTSVRVSYDGKYWGVSGSYGFNKEFGQRLGLSSPRMGQKWGHQIVIPVKYRWQQYKYTCRVRGNPVRYTYDIKPYEWDPTPPRVAIAQGNNIGYRDGKLQYNRAPVKYRSYWPANSSYALDTGRSQKYEVAVKAFGLGFSFETAYGRESGEQHMQLIEFGSSRKWYHKIFNFNCPFGKKRCSKKAFYSY